MAHLRSLLVTTAFLIAMAGLAMFGLYSVVAAAPPISAIVQFGDPNNAGSPFPPPDGHDSSPHAADKLIPRTAVISQGGTVTFQINGGTHQVAVYDDGVRSGDIDTTVHAAGCAPVPVPLIDDDGNRLAVLGAQPCGGGLPAPSFTFDDPGRYLVICTFLPHFAQADMYGWVIVK